jgi:hypothetical protein
VNVVQHKLVCALCLCPPRCLDTRAFVLNLICSRRCSSWHAGVRSAAKLKGVSRTLSVSRHSRCIAGNVNEILDAALPRSVVVGGSRSSRPSDKRTHFYVRRVEEWLLVDSEVDHHTAHLNEKQVAVPSDDIRRLPLSSEDDEMFFVSAPPRRGMP